MIVTACLLVLGILRSRTEAADSNPFVHPGVYQSRQDLDYLKAQILAGRQPWKSAFDRMLVVSPEKLVPRPHTYVIRGSYGRPNVGGADLSNSAMAANECAIAWYVTGDRAYAAKAIEIMNAWSSALWNIDDNDAKLLAGWTGVEWCNAAEIIRYTGAGWPDADVRQFKRMLLEVYSPLIQDFFPEANGNWDAAMMASMESIAIFCDDHAMFDRVVEHYVRGPGNGGLTKYIYPSGQCEETTRDAAHTQLGLGYLADTCQIAWTQGVDLYSAADNRLALGLEYSAQYDEGQNVPIKGIPSRPGRLSDIYQAAYQHYHDVEGIDLPAVLEAVMATSGSSSVKLLESTRAPSSPGKNISKSDLAPSTIAVQAMPRSPVEKPSADAVYVKPGESIQRALDANPNSARTIMLGRGLYVLSASLRIPSNITLNGMGTDENGTILMLGTNRGGTDVAVVINETPDMHDLTISNLVIEGATTFRPTTADPNQDRRTRSYQLALRRAGILFDAMRLGEMQNITLDHVIVRDCTLSGVAVRGASSVNLTACDFSDNGGSVVPGPGLAHNLLIAWVGRCTVRDSQFDSSCWGCGIDATESTDLMIERNELARNHMSGIRITDCRNVTIRGNLAEGNDEDGIECSSRLDGNYNVTIISNVSRNNGRSGIGTTQTTGVECRDNLLDQNMND